MKSRGPGHISILVLSATAGAGHVRAGEALVAAADAFASRIRVVHEDVLNFTSATFKSLYNDFYFSVVDRAPELWGYLYKKSEFRGSGRKKHPFLKLFDHFNYKRYLAALDHLRPDAVLCTHFLPYAAIADRLASASWRIPFYAVPTDYSVHSLWINPSIRRFYVATEEAAWTVRSHDIPASRIMVTGIPVMPQFAAHTGRHRAARELGVSPGLFTIMVLSGGYGIGVIDRLVPAVADYLAAHGRRRFQMIVICGKNKSLFDALAAYAPPANVDLRLFRYVPFVDKAMACSDVLITKSGGLTVSEALAVGLPMIVFDPIPGQEAYNADYVIERGAAVRANTMPGLTFKLKEILERPANLETMREHARSIGRADAAQRILRDVADRVEEGRSGA